MSHTLTNVLVHVVFATKNREKTLTAAVRPRLHAYLTAAVQDEGGCVHIVNGGLEHVHMLLRLAASQSLSDLMRQVKTNSSRWMRQEVAPHIAWQRGYSAFSVSHSQFAAVHDYIANQEDRHRHRTYEVELVSLLKRNEIAELGWPDEVGGMFAGFQRWLYERDAG